MEGGQDRDRGGRERAGGRKEGRKRSLLISALSSCPYHLSLSSSLIHTACLYISFYTIHISSSIFISHACPSLPALYTSTSPTLAPTYLYTPILPSLLYMVWDRATAVLAWFVTCHRVAWHCFMAGGGTDRGGLGLTSTYTAQCLQHACQLLPPCLLPPYQKYTTTHLPTWEVALPTLPASPPSLPTPTLLSAHCCTRLPPPTPSSSPSLVMRQGHGFGGLWPHVSPSSCSATSCFCLSHTLPLPPLTALLPPPCLCLTLFRLTPLPLVYFGQ